MKFGKILKALYAMTTETYPRNKRMAQELNAIHTQRKKRGENTSITTDTGKKYLTKPNTFS